MYSIQNINFNSDIHSKCILILSKRNNFYTDDLYGLIYGKVKLSSVKNNFDKMVNGLNVPYPNDNQFEKMKIELEKNLYLKMYKNLPNCKGLFICIDNKPIGFVLFSSRKGLLLINIEVDLLFILIDETHRRKGYGKILINELKTILQQNTDIIIANITDDNADKFFTNLEFIKKEDVNYNSGINNKIIYGIKSEELINKSSGTNLYYILKK